MKQRAISSFFFLAILVVVLHSAIPHHHHNGAVIMHQEGHDQDGEDGHPCGHHQSEQCFIRNMDLDVPRAFSQSGRSHQSEDPAGAGIPADPLHTTCFLTGPAIIHPSHGCPPLCSTLPGSSPERGPPSL